MTSKELLAIFGLAGTVVIVLFLAPVALVFLFSQKLTFKLGELCVAFDKHCLGLPRDTADSTNGIAVAVTILGLAMVQAGTLIIAVRERGPIDLYSWQSLPYALGALAISAGLAGVYLSTTHARGRVFRRTFDRGTIMTVRFIGVLVAILLLLGPGLAGFGLLPGQEPLDATTAVVENLQHSNTRIDVRFRVAGSSLEKFDGRFFIILTPDADRLLDVGTPFLSADSINTVEDATVLYEKRYASPAKTRSEAEGKNDVGAEQVNTATNLSVSEANLQPRAVELSFLNYSSKGEYDLIVPLIVDDSRLPGPDPEEISSIFQKIQHAPAQYIELLYH